MGERQADPQAEVVPRSPLRSVVTRPQITCEWLRHFSWTAQVYSTQDLARDWALGGGELPALFAADYQSRGRGRWGRSWVAPPGKALVFTVVSEWPPAPAWWLLGSAVTWAEAIEGVAGVPVRIKWPNDLLLGERKLGGGLLEVAQEGKRLYALLGWGINVNLTPDDFPADLRSRAVSLREFTGCPGDRVALLEAFLERLPGLASQIRCDELKALRRRWLALSDTIGRRVRVVAGGQVWEGQAAGLDRQGALQVDTDSGRIAVAVGEVEYLGQARQAMPFPRADGFESCERDER